MNDWYFVISCFLSRYLRTPYFRHSPLNKIKEVAMLLMTPRTWRAFATVAVLLALAACTQAPSWQKLLTAKILAQFPGYEVQPVADGNVVVRRPGSLLDEHAVMRLFEGALARYKWPARVLFRDQLPKTALGKVRKPALRDWINSL